MEAKQHEKNSCSWPALDVLNLPAGGGAKSYTRAYKISAELSPSYSEAATLLEQFTAGTPGRRYRGGRTDRGKIFKTMKEAAATGVGSGKAVGGQKMVRTLGPLPDCRVGLSEVNPGK